MLQTTRYRGIVGGEGKSAKRVTSGWRALTDMPTSLVIQMRKPLVSKPPVRHSPKLLFSCRHWLRVVTTWIACRFGCVCVCVSVCSCLGDTWQRQAKGPGRRQEQESRREVASYCFNTPLTKSPLVGLDLRIEGAAIAVEMETEAVFHQNKIRNGSLFGGDEPTPDSFPTKPFPTLPTREAFSRKCSLPKIHFHLHPGCA